MRVIVKFSGALLVGICGIQAAHAVENYQREVAYFEKDMSLDHLVVGRAVATMIATIWQHEGKAAALHIPARIEQGGRHLQLTTIDPAVASPAWNELAETTRRQLGAHEPVVARSGGFHRTFLPVDGPKGEHVVLVVREPLAEEDAFSAGSRWRNLVVTLGVIALCSITALVTGLLWIDRPIRALCEGARRIGRGDLTGPVRIDGNNEFSLLATELDAMRASLLQAGAAVAAETEQRIAALEQLRHADRLATVGRLAAGVAHELGTPLNVVGETAKMIRSGELAGAELREGAGVIVEQADRMSHIIRQVLDFARPRAAVKAPTDLAALCQRTLHLLQNMAHQRGVALQFAGGGGTADVDAAQMQQVLTNLLVNALQATARGGRVAVLIEPSDARPPAEPGSEARRWHRIDVRDTGHGISPEHLRRLFEPFFTTKGVGEGTGLGLSVARGIVREHGGWIAVSSTVGAGTCFSVFLPAMPPEVPDGR